MTNTNIGAAGSTFREGDEVVLVSGSHPGTLGVFLRLKEDINWADIRERNGEIRSHPVIWLAYAPKPDPGSRN
jgi:hypothetical protein